MYRWKCLSVDAPSRDVPSLSVFFSRSCQRTSRHHAVTSRDVTLWHHISFDDINLPSRCHQMSWNVFQFKMVTFDDMSWCGQSDSDREYMYHTKGQDFGAKLSRERNISAHPCRQAVPTSTTLPTPVAQGNCSTVFPLMGPKFQSCPSFLTSLSAMLPLRCLPTWAITEGVYFVEFDIDCLGKDWWQLCSCMLDSINFKTKIKCKVSWGEKIYSMTFTWTQCITTHGYASTLTHTKMTAILTNCS